MRRITIATLITLVISATPASSQQLAPSGATVYHVVDTARATTDSLGKEEGSRVVGAARGALIGAGVGAFSGFITVAILTGSERNHSEDGLAYMILGTLGAAVGLVSGAIIGAVTAR
ncbi:MAG: hypothetical protein ABJE10_05225 [bacterium]